jgi:hypothetical protein
MFCSSVPRNGPPPAGSPYFALHKGIAIGFVKAKVFATNLSVRFLILPHFRAAMLNWIQGLRIHPPQPDQLGGINPVVLAPAPLGILLRHGLLQRRESTVASISNSRSTCTLQAKSIQFP